MPGQARKRTRPDALANDARAIAERAAAAAMLGWMIRVKAGSFGARKPSTVDVPPMPIVVRVVTAPAPGRSFGTSAAFAHPNVRRDARADPAPQAVSDATFPTWSPQTARSYNQRARNEV
jgi:hypothetical protein